MKVMERIEQMNQLKEKGFSYGSIGELFSISRQRVHQLISGYIAPSYRHHKNGKYTYIDLILKSIFVRDDYICQKCGGKGTLIHHIDKNNFNNLTNNLICLCSDCHLDLHSPKKFPEWVITKGNKYALGCKRTEKAKKKLSDFAKTRKRKNGRFV